MPLQRQGHEGLSGFAGVNLRRDTLSLADADLARAINADLHTMPGVILRRKGRTAQYVTPLPDPIRYVARHNTRLYQVAGAVAYRAQTSILTGLEGTRPTRMVTYTPLNDPTTWVFLADANVMRKDDGTTVHVWGIEVPAAAPTLAVGAAGSLTGDYRARYTYARVVDGSVAHEGNPSDAPNAVALTSDELAVTVVASSDPQVTHIRVYRTVAGGSTYLFDQQVTNASATVASSQGDGALGAALETDNDLPPASHWIAEYQSHVFFLDASLPTHVWWSKKFRPESVPSANFVRIGTPDDPLQCLVPMSGFLGIFSRRTKYRLSGNATSGFAYLEAMNTRGTPAPQAVLATSRGVGFWARDGLFATNFLQADQELTTAIQPLFYGETVHDFAPINWAEATQFSLGEYKKRVYAGYVDTANQRMLAVYSADTLQWYFYAGHPHRSLYYDEEDDTLMMGATDGIVYLLETGTDDDGTTISMEATLATRAGGDRFLLKHFGFWAVDIVVYAATTATLVIDGEVTYAWTLAVGGRFLTRDFLRLPHDVLGYTWTIQFVGAFDLYACEALGAPLEKA